MERLLTRGAYACMAILAAIWPLGVFTFVPGVNLHATTILTLLAFAMLALDTLRQRRLRVPFEFASLCLAIAAVTLYLALTSSGDTPRQLLLALAIFVVPVHFRPSAMQIRRWIDLTAISGIAAATTTAVGWLAGWMPTAYSLSTGAGLHFAWSMAGGICSLLVFLVLTTALVLRPRTHTLFRISWALGAMLIAAVAATTIAAHAHAFLTPNPPRLTLHNPAALILALVLLYGAARIIAKVKVDAEERPDNLHALFLLVLSAMAVGATLAGDVPMVGFAFMAGLAAAHALRAREPEPGPALQPVALAIAAALLLMNALMVFPAHRLDGRNYSVAAGADLDAGAFDRLHRRLDIVERHAPEERLTHWWRARVLLAQARPMRAVTEFKASLTPASRLLLPAPGAAEQEIFLLQLRDAESALRAPHTAYAYARALVAVGNADEALAFVRLQSQSSTTVGQKLDSAPLADAVAFLLGDTQLATQLQNWESERLLAVLRNWGAEIVTAPEWFDPGKLPVVLAGAFELDTTQTLVTLPGDRDLQEKPFTVEPQPTANMATSWTPIFGDARKWVVEWSAPTQGRGPARITGREETWDLLTYPATLTAIPEHAAVTVWLPATVAAAGE